MRINVVNMCNDAGYVVGRSVYYFCCSFAVMFGGSTGWLLAGRVMKKILGNWQ
jgi:hypothetical protein